MQIKDSTLLITGGSSGLGAACVKRLADLGANIVILDLNEEAGRKLEADYINVRFSKGSVTDEDDVEVAIDLAISEFGGINSAINCAGVAIARKVVSSRGNHTLEEFAKVININLIGTFNVIRLVAAAAKRFEPDASGERGVIINTASVAAFDGQIGQSAYAASKGGIVGLTLPIAREFASLGIRVCTIAPGLFLTPMLSGLPEAAQQSLAQQVPFPPRLGDPDEYAALAQHIIENQMLNGEVIRLDGAIRMAPR